TVSLHASDQVQLQAGVRWDDDHAGHSGWTPLNRAVANGAFDVPEVQLDVMAKVYAEGQVNLLLYDIVGQAASIETAVVFDLATPRHPFAQVKIAETVSTGVEVSLFGFWEATLSANLPEIDIPLGGSSNIAPFIISVSPGDGT